MAMVRRISFVLTFILISLLSAAPAQAQSSSATSLPLIYAQQLTVTVTTPTALTGTFTALSQDPTTVGGLQYDVVVLSPAPTPQDNTLTADTPLVYARLTTSDTFILRPKERSQRNFSVTLPALPQGDYRIRVQLKTSNDRELGWADTALTLGNATTFGILTPRSVHVASTDPVTNKQRTDWAPLEGVNVDSNQALTFTLTANNSTNTAFTAPLTLSTYRLFSHDQPTSMALDQTVSFPANQNSQTITIPLTVAAQPGAYRLYLTLTDKHNQPVSNLAEFRYVVRGASASIISARLQQPAIKANQTAIVAFTVVGAADQTTTQKGTLTLTLSDHDSDAGTTSAPVDLSLGAVSGTATITLTRDITKQLGLTLILADEQKNTLATYHVDYPEYTQATPLAPAPPLVRISLPPYFHWGLLAALVLLLLTGLGYLGWRRWQRKPTAPTAMLTFLLALTLSGLGVFVTRTPVVANGVQYTYFNNGNSLIEVFVNSPVHDSWVISPVIYWIRTEWAASLMPINTTNDLVVLTRPGRVAASPDDNPELVLKRNLGIQGFLDASPTYTGYFNPAWRGVGRNPLPGGTYVLTLSLPDGPQTIWTRTGVMGGSGRLLRELLDDFTFIKVGLPQCSDGKDNDGDKKIDSADPGCHTDGIAGNASSFKSDDDDEVEPPLPKTSFLFSSDGGRTYHPNLTGVLAVNPGQEIIVNLQYDNQGGQAGTGASLHTTLPSGFNRVTTVTTKNCIEPSGSEFVCNTAAGYGSSLQDSALWSGPTLTVAPTAGLYDLSGGLTVGYLEIGKKRYLNFQDCDYILTDGTNTDDVVGFDPSNNVGHMTCGSSSGAVILRPANSRFEPIDILARRYGNFQDCDYKLNNRDNTDDIFGFGPSNTPGHFTCQEGPSGTDGYHLRLEHSLFTSLDHLGKRYLNFQDCDYILVKGNNSDDVLGFNPGNTAGRFNCTAGDPATFYTYLRPAQTPYNPLDLLDATRGAGHIIFRMQAASTPGIYTESASLTGSNFSTVYGAGQIEVKAGPSPTVTSTVSPTPTPTASPTTASTTTPTPSSNLGNIEEVD